jgi:MFS transporter, OFA family, oxalate/formate antiporter
MVGSGNDASFMVLTFILGLTFGSNFVTYAADCCRIWGVDKLDIIYPMVSIAYGIAGIIGPIAGGLIRDITGTYYIAIVVGVIICITGIAAYAFLSPLKSLKSLPNTEKQSALLSAKRAG